MSSANFISRLCLLAAMLALASCGKKSEETSTPQQPQEEAHAPEYAAELALVEQAEITKVSSQGAAAEQAAGVFLRAAEGDPEAVFLARCQYCHVQLGPGTITLAKRLGEEDALLANRTDLTKDYVSTVVRKGLNTMPALTRVEVSDEELELIAQYLTRNNADPDE